MNEKTHLFITKTALELAETNLSKAEKDIVICSSILPDKDENEGTFKNHFYNPATHKNFKGERTSALTKVIEHYQKSKNGNNLEELGRSLHFLEDLCTPVHTFYDDLFDAVVRLEQHVHFEKICDSLVDDFKLENKLETMKYYTHNSLKTICKSCAMKSSILFKQMDDGKIRMAQVGKKSIENGIQAVAGILYRFENGVTVWN